MLSTRWQPSLELNRLRDEMDRMFSQYNGGRTHAHAFPPLNIWEDDDHLFVEAELPGFELDDLEIFVTGGNQLAISGERRQHEHEGGAWHRQERSFGKFRRTIDLTSEVNSEQVSATLRDGVLTLTMPKREEVKPRRIDVKSN